MVKFSFENLNLSEMLDYITKLENDINENEIKIGQCNSYIPGLTFPQYPNESGELYRLRNIKTYFRDKQNKSDLLKFSRKKKQLITKLEDLEIYLIDIGVIKINIIEDEVEDEQIENEI